MYAHRGSHRAEARFQARLTVCVPSRVGGGRAHPEVRLQAQTPLFPVCTQTHRHTQRGNKLAAAPKTKAVNHREVQGVEREERMPQTYLLPLPSEPCWPGGLPGEDCMGRVRFEGEVGSSAGLEYGGVGRLQIFRENKNIPTIINRCVILGRLFNSLGPEESICQAGVI